MDEARKDEIAKRISEGVARLFDGDLSGGKSIEEVSARILTSYEEERTPSGEGWQPIEFLKGLITKLHDGAQRCERSGLPGDLRTLWKGKAIAYETILGAIEQLLKGQNAKDATLPASSGEGAK